MSPATKPETSETGEGEQENWANAPKARKFEDVTAKFTILKEKNQSVEGKLVAVGSRDFTDDESGDETSVKLYTLETDSGERLAVLGSTDLDQHMSIIKMGEYVRITLADTTKSKRGRPVKNFKVERETA